MSTSGEQLESLKEELKWIHSQKNEGSLNKARQKGIFAVLIPVGCLVTAGILGAGIYSFFKRDQKKQQLLMRYRVLAQGITLVITTIGIYQIKK